MAATAIGYLLGSLPFALLVARRHGVDLHRSSDGNPGAWNALEQLGPRRAWPAFAGDGLKGTLAGLCGLALVGDWGAYAGVGGAMLGHAFPLFARFRGGKSVMTFVGGAPTLSPPAFACAALAAVVAGAPARSLAIGARVGVFSFPLWQLLFDPLERVAATGGLMTLIGALFIARPDRSGRASFDSAAGQTR